MFNTEVMVKFEMKSLMVKQLNNPSLCQIIIFAVEPQNLKFMLASDDIQPFSHRSTNNSVWHVT